MDENCHCHLSAPRWRPPRRRSLVALVFGITILGAACSTKFKVKSGYDAALMNDPRQTYGWMLRVEDSIPDLPYDRARIDSRIRTAINTELAAKGYVLRTLGAPDVLIGYRLKVRTAHLDTFQDAYHYYSAGGNDDFQDAYAVGYEEGTLSIEMIDAKTRQRIWWATAAPLLESKGRRDLITDAVHQMFTTLPVNPAQVTGEPVQ